MIILTAIKYARVIHSKKLAEYLMTSGFKLLYTLPNPYKIGFVSFAFEDSEELDEVMTKYMIKNKRLQRR